MIYRIVKYETYQLSKCTEFTVDWIPEITSNIIYRIEFKKYFFSKWKLIPQEFKSINICRQYLEYLKKQPIKTIVR